MITQQQLLEAIVHECEICKRLYGELPAGAHDYRPTEGQRSTLELLRYMSFGLAATAHALFEGNWDWWNANEEKAKAMPFEGFPAAMDEQIEEFRGLFSEIKAEEFAEKPVTTKLLTSDQPLCVGLLKKCYAFCVGYKMQLFLYAKAAGASKLGTGECWYLGA